MNLETFEKIKRQVHQEPDYDEILKNPSSSYMQKVTCFGAAIGATIATYTEDSLYHLGIFSGLRGTYGSYDTIDIINNLYIADMIALELNVEKLNINLSFSTKQTIEEIPLKENQYLNLLFANAPRENVIMGYHFLRYDLKYGWTETWPRKKLFIGDEVQFPHEWFWKLIGVYRVTR